MTTSPITGITLHGDQEHTSLRIAVVLIVVGGFAVLFLILDTILSRTDGLFASYAFTLSCVLALVLALAAATLAEAYMKRHWPSGRKVEIDDQGLRAWLRGDEKVILQWSKRVWAVKWTFALAGYPRGGRERRLAKGHHCLACQLQQDESRVIVYGYLQEKQASAFLEASEFHRIRPGEHYQRGPLTWFRGRTDRPELPTSVLAGKDGPYWLAEQRRWTRGIELTAGDFVIFWENVKDRLEG
jgi:hypothetical protein